MYDEFNIIHKAESGEGIGEQQKYCPNTFILHYWIHPTPTFDGVTTGDAFRQQHAIMEREIEEIPVKVHATVFHAVRHS